MILAFWALGFLSVFAVYMGYGARAKLSMSKRINQNAMLRHIARSGIARFRADFSAPDASDIKGFLRSLLAYSNAMDEDVKFGRGRMIVTAFDAERALNINTAPADVLARLIKEVCSVPDAEAQAAADGIIDWRDADSSPQPGGAEDVYYNSLPEPYDARDGFFSQTDELLLVRGITGKMGESLLPYVTVCGAGAVNINTARAPVLRAVGLDNRLVDKILRYRAGEDGQEGTEDDPCMARMSSAASGFDFSDPRLITLTPEDEAALDQKAQEGLLDTAVTYLNVRSDAMMPGAVGSLTVWATFHIAPREEGGWDMKLTFWRTSL